MSHPELTRNLHHTVASARLALTPIPGSAGIALYLIAEDFPRGALPHEEMLAILEAPAYWAFCWASGQVLANFLAERPEICRGKSVLDLGAGSGVVAIAAARSGATRTIACDLDPMALDACRINALENDVNLTMLDNLADLDARVDLLIAADVLYDRENLDYLDDLSRYTREVIIADSRIRDPSVFKDFTRLACITATTIPDLDELKEFGEVSVYHRRYD